MAYVRFKMESHTWGPSLVSRLRSPKNGVITDRNRFNSSLFSSVVTRWRSIEERFVQNEKEENPLVVEIHFVDCLNEPSIDTFGSRWMIQRQWTKKISMIPKHPSIAKTPKTSHSLQKHSKRELDFEHFHLSTCSIVELIEKSSVRRNWRRKETFDELGIQMIDAKMNKRNKYLTSSGSLLFEFDFD